MFLCAETQVRQWPSVLASTRAPFVNTKRSSDNPSAFGVARNAVTPFAGGAWEPFTRASDANNRILRRSVDGATTADMAFIAQEAAMNYERELANRPSLEEE